MTQIVRLLVLTLLLAATASAYTSYIRAPAVLLNEDQGVLTHASLNVTSGSGIIAVNGNGTVGESTTDSAITAVTYAANYLGLNEKDYNFEYSIDNASNVSGPSAGLAFTLLAISALEKRPLSGNFTVTGTISENGSVGEIGGVYNKVMAAKQGGMSYVLVPAAPAGSFEDELYYIAQQHSGIPLVEVANVTQAIPYAFEQGAVTRLALNLSQSSNFTDLPYANMSCGNCNSSAFRELANYTFNVTTAEVESLNSSFSSIKGQFLSALEQDRQLEKKGYLYTASDLAFLNYVNAFTFAATGYPDTSYADLVIQNLTYYCESLTPPPLTSLNYEYVVGGEVRQSWGIANLALAQEAVNESEDSDDILQALDIAGSSSGWCNAAGEMYTIAASQGGSYVNTSSALESAASSYINNQELSGSMYIQAAILDYKVGRYAAALYSGIYAETFDNPAAQPPNASEITPGLIYQRIGNATGIWPLEFDNQALFYLNQAEKAGNATVKDSNLESAYTTVQLASGLNTADKEIVSSFYNVTLQQATAAEGSSDMEMMQSIDEIQGEISQLYYIMLVLLVLLFLILVVLLLHLAKPRKKAPRQKRQGR